MKSGRSLIFALGLGVMWSTAIAAAQSRAIPDGRWDLDVHRGAAQQPSWMQVTMVNSVPHVDFVGPVGDAAAAAKVVVHGGELSFVVLKDANEGKDFDVEYQVHVVNGRISGTSRATDGTTATLTGVRAPTLPHRTKVGWAKPLNLFDGKDFDGWHFSSAKHANWSVEGGTLRNAGHGAELISDRKFQDFKLHLEFHSGPNSNSGLYLRGRYEVQIETNSASEKASHHTGGVYGFLAPQPEQPRAPDMWQTFDVVLVGRTLTVVQNGITIIDHKEIPGITGGALDSQEGEAGPIYLQGSEDGTTMFRNIVLTPATTKG